MAKRYKPLPEAELHAILRAADDIIDEGGRTLLSKILKGSKDSRLLQLGLHKNPSYGYFANLSLEEITQRIDHMIRTDYLDNELSGKLPMIVFTARGWAIERERRCAEYLREWDIGIDNHITPISFEYLKDRNRGMILLFLYKIMMTGDKKYIPYLKLWSRVDYKKVQAEISHVINVLEKWESLDELVREQLIRERAEILLQRGKKPIILVCEECDNPFVFDEQDPDSYTDTGLRFPTMCPTCRVTL